MLFLWLILLVVFVILFYIHVNGNYNENYWKKRGVAFYKKNRIIGPFMDFMTSDRPLFQSFEELYHNYPDEPAVAMGSFWTPSIFVKDAANIKHVLQTEFMSFNHAGIEPLKNDVLTDNILFQSGPRWKLVRQNMTPIFTSAKLKNMYYIVDKSAQDFVKYLKNNPERLKDNAFDTLSSFCSAAITGAVFGISNEDKSVFDSPFLDMARKTTKSTFWNNLKISLATVSPSLVRLLGLKVFKDHEDFFVGAIKEVLNQRRAENIKRHDFADTCLNIEKNGTMRDSTTNYEIEPSVELFAAQAFFFFIAGVEPTALAGYGTLLELGKNSKYLNMVHEEIDAAFEKHGGNISFDTISELEVLDKVYNEALRIHPPVGILTRKCTNNAVLPIGNIRIDSGTIISVPVFAVHHDPKHYPNPETFDPERWAPGGGANKDLFMPFGKGNRVCIGSRYATLQIKAGLVHLLRHFTVKTHMLSDTPKYAKHAIQVKLENVKVELISRDLSSVKQ